MVGINLKTASEHAKFECIERQYHKKVTPDEKSSSLKSVMTGLYINSFVWLLSQAIHTLVTKFI